MDQERDLSEYENIEDGQEGSKPSSVDNKLPDAEITTLFATSDYGILMQDSFPVENSGALLPGVPSCAESMR